MICIMENGRLQNDFMQNLSSHHKVVEKVAADNQVLVLQPKEPNVSKDESCKHLAKIVQPPIRTRLKTINSYASPPFVSNDRKGLKT